MATSTTPRPDSGTSPARSTARKTKSSSKRRSRAVVRDVEAGSQVDCPHCGERVKFQAKMRNKQVICNIYVRGDWNRVEHYHLACYLEAGQPHGNADLQADTRRVSANAPRRDAAAAQASDAGA